MQKVTPFLWFDNQAEEAINLYTSIFENSRISNVNQYENTGPHEDASVMTASFELAGQEFMALNGGPEFKFTPAISFFVNCESEQEIDALYQPLSSGGLVLMPLQEYPFSKKFGWVQDRFGLSWQLNLGEAAQKIVPFMLFVGEQHGKAEAAINDYISLFKESSLLRIERHSAGEGETEGTVKQAVFTLHGQEFMAMDSGLEHNFTFNEALSLYVDCDTQEEVDRLWDKLSQGGEIQQCGWLKDRYGVSWQIVPSALGKLMNDPDASKSQRVMHAMLQMKKIEIAGLEKAYAG